MHGIEQCEHFQDALSEGAQREQHNWHIGTYQRLGYYAQHIKPYLETFGPERVRVFLFDDLVQAPEKLIRDVFEFLEIDPDFKPDLAQRFNETGTLANPLLRFIWRDTRRLRSHIIPYIPMKLRGLLFNLIAGSKIKKEKKVPIDPQVRKQLTEHYREDILQLQDLLGRDLKHWLD